MPRGKLTRVEYKLLSQAKTSFRKAVGRNTVNWTAARASCASLGSSTPLLASQRSDCSTQVALVHVFVAFPASDARCGNKTPQQFVCALPIFAALNRGTSAFYAAESGARDQAVSRGLSGRCLATLAPPASVVAQERKLAALTSALYRDMQLVVKVSDGKAPAGKLDLATVNADVKQFEQLGTEVVLRSAPTDIAACPHA